jgi:aminoglycoside phosphotransferase (APT) family kinase protein
MTTNSPAAGLRAPPVQHTFDTARLADWMRTHIEGFSGPIDVQQFAGGQSNPTFLV